MNPETICVKIKSKEREWILSAKKGTRLWELLQQHKIQVSYPCQGNGTCGKCRVKVLKGESPVTEADALCLTEEERKQKLRLACRMVLNQDFEIELPESLEEKIAAESVPVSKKVSYESSFLSEGVLEKKRETVKEDADCEKEQCFIAIDIGTTTIAMALVEEKTGQVWDTYTSWNHQKIYGADVISRIKASMEGKREELKKTIEEDLWKGICSLAEDKDSFGEKEGAAFGKKRRVTGCVIAGNTTMVHILMGYSCESIAKAPFYSEHLEQIQCTLKECISICSDVLACIPVTILPGISAFVGADVTAGMLACASFETKELSLLLDLGTNGEMVLGNQDRLLAASTAAGPAFEGGNITCGMASAPGAISRVKLQNNRAVVQTIGNKMPPAGICGSGLISVIAELKRNHLLDENGTLSAPYDQKGYPLWIFPNGKRIALYQKDIRQFQLAKAAIRAGIEVLLERCGCKAKQVKHVYLAGGFGKGLSVEDAVETGILAAEFKGKTVAVGNGCLKGCIRIGTEDGKRNTEIEEILRRVSAVSLAGESSFEKKYLEQMKL